jgi:hypothetical protein
MRSTVDKHIVGQPRALRETEAALLNAMMLAKPEIVPLLVQLKGALVQEMNDGGMGSLQFVDPEGRRFGSRPVEAAFHDTDGTFVSVAVMLDQFGALWQLDIWKVDNSSLIRIPPPIHVQIG